MPGQLNSGSAPSPRVYAELIQLYKSSDALGGEFSTCFTELQRNFVDSRPTKVKSLIRLVKHWYKQVCQLSFQPSGYGFHQDSVAMKPAPLERSMRPQPPALGAV